MIRFFRKIRIRLLKDQRLGNYMMYALGEIFLVVIGILIALQINNWNADRQQNKNYINILHTIREDMMIDTAAINYTMDLYKKKEYAFVLSKKDTIDLEAYKSCAECPKLIASFTPFILQTKGFKQMESFNARNELEAKDSLNLKISAFYQVYTFAINKAVDFAADHFQEYTQLLRESKPWFKDWSDKKYDDEFYDYVLHDPIYKNRVAEYYTIIYQYYLRVLTGARNTETDILELIDQKLGIENN
ncbi:MAG: hypothetical protein KDC49_14385 [Saprospiraceae bacterium]|nr:hypothetical protein [Saprospiraceae bacterium]